MTAAASASAGADERRAPFSRVSGLAVLAWALTLLALAAVVTALPLGSTAGQPAPDAAAPGLVELAFSAVGLLIVMKQRGNRIGWLFVIGGVFISLQSVASFYTLLSYRLGHHLPFAPLALVLQPSWAPAIVCFGLAVMLFPDGEVPFPGLRWIVRVYLAVGAVWVVGAVVITVWVIAEGQVRVDAQGNLVNLDSPSGGSLWWGVTEIAFFILLASVSLASLAGQAVRFHRSAGDRRQQLKWLLTGTAVTIPGLTLSIALGSDGGFWQAVGQLSFLFVAALPLSVGVAVLRYRLYDIDRLISRTLGYAAVTGVLVGAYAGLVLLATRVLPFSSDAAVAISTLAAAAVFNPLRRRVQRLVDRRFNRARYDADVTVAAFAARLQDAVDLNAVRADLAETVQRALEPEHLAVWTWRGDPSSVPPG
jgi:hypothetical protein